MKKETGFNFWSYSLKVKNTLKSDIEELRNKISPLKTWVDETKAQHTAKGTDFNRDATFVEHAGRLIALSAELKVKQALYIDVVKVRMEQGEIYRANKAIANAEEFANTEVCTA